MKTIFTTIILLSMIFIAGIAWSDIIHIPDDYPTIQAGIDAAVDGDTVLVTDGMYTGEGNKNLDFKRKAITVKSENGAENCIIDCEDSGKGFSFYSKETSDAIVDGFTIKNGRANKGGGISCDNSSPTIRNNIITENFAQDGGGIYCGNGSNAIIQSNIISSNIADYWGGGISTPFSSPIITGNLITENVAALQGGGGQGGGIAAYGNSSPIISNNVITKNSAVLNPDIDLEVGGGAISLDAYANAIIVNNTIDQNHTEYGFGGGIFCDFNASPIITNNVIVNSTKGAGIWVSSVDAYPILTYNDVWNNEGGEYIGISPGIGDISINPLFVDAANGDYHLSNWSPCIGKGIITDDVPTTDKEGNPRPKPPDSNPDMGAYENNRPTPLPRGDVSGNENVTAFDASLVLRHVVGSKNLSEAQLEAADVTNDGNVSALDAALILQYSVGLITKFPVETKTAAPVLAAKSEEGALIKAIAQLEATTLNREQKQVLGRLKNLFFEKSPPKNTLLLQNFPNPFNPETWIPYQLANDSVVIISIYNAKGQIIRTITLGNKNAGIYVTKEKAAYWNGKNDDGEKVASGIYFYTLQTGEFRATRKMIIEK